MSARGPVDGKLARMSDVTLHGSELRGFELFENLSDDELSLIAKETVRRAYAAGRIVCEEDSASDSMFLIKSGTVDIIKQGVSLAELGPGDYFGEMSLITGDMTKKVRNRAMPSNDQPQPHSSSIVNVIRNCRLFSAWRGLSELRPVLRIGEPVQRSGGARAGRGGSPRADHARRTHRPRACGGRTRRPQCSPGRVRDSRPQAPPWLGKDWERATLIVLKNPAIWPIASPQR